MKLSLQCVKIRYKFILLIIVKHIKLLVLFSISFLSSCSEVKQIFLKCDYDASDKWIKLSADKNNDVGSMERDNGYSQGCNVTFTSSNIIWSCKGPVGNYEQQFRVNRGNLAFNDGGSLLGKCEVIATKKTKNRI